MKRYFSNGNPNYKPRSKRKIYNFCTDLAPTVDDITRICGVTERTARRWLSNETAPPKAMVRLVELELRGRIMPENWPHFWRWNHNGLLEAETNFEALHYNHIGWYQYIRAGWYRSISVIPELEKTIDYLMDKLPKAEVIQLQAYREQLRELQRLGEMTPDNIREFTDKKEQPAPQEKVTHRLYGC